MSLEYTTKGHLLILQKHERPGKMQERMLDELSLPVQLNKDDPQNQGLQWNNLQHQNQQTTRDANMQRLRRQHGEQPHEHLTTRSKERGELEQGKQWTGCPRSLITQGIEQSAVLEKTHRITVKTRTTTSIGFNEHAPADLDNGNINIRLFLPNMDTIPKPFIDGMTRLAQLNARKYIRMILRGDNKSMARNNTLIGRVEMELENAASKINYDRLMKEREQHEKLERTTIEQNTANLTSTQTGIVLRPNDLQHVTFTIGKEHHVQLVPRMEIEEGTPKQNVKEKHVLVKEQQIQSIKWSGENENGPTRELDESEQFNRLEELRKQGVQMEECKMTKNGGSMAAAIHQPDQPFQGEGGSTIGLKDLLDAGMIF